MNQSVTRYSFMTHFLDMRTETLEIDPTTDAFEYIAKDGELWTDLAWRFLGNAQYYWVLLDINNVMNPFDPLTPGQRILIPLSAKFQELVNG